MVPSQILIYYASSPQPPPGLMPNIEVQLCNGLGVLLWNGLGRCLEMFDKMFEHKFVVISMEGVDGYAQGTHGLGVDGHNYHLK